MSDIKLFDFEKKTLSQRSEIEQTRIDKADLMLKKTLKTLARCYCMLILGLGSAEYHHMNGGK